MATVTIRVPKETDAKIRELAAARGKRPGQLITEAIDRYEEAAFWDEYDRQAAALRQNPAAWREWQRETSVFDGTLIDGLESEGWRDE
jgi:predicted transcriptional regulator